LSSAVRFAFGNARVRAMKSRLRGPAEVAASRTRRRRGAPRKWRDEGALFSELVADTETVLRSYPDTGADLFRALLRLQELENLKLAWRSIVHSLPAERWLPLWRPLGWNRSLDPETLLSGNRELSFGRGLLEGAPVPAGGDPSAAELAWDSWGSRELLRAARSLPRAEELARRIATALVRERDLQIVRRGVPNFGMTPAAVAASTVLVSEELEETAVEGLSRWTPADGPLERSVAKRLGLKGPAPGNWPALELALRRSRRALCRSAFRGDPFCFAPAVAYLALKEEEIRGLRALAEAEAAGSVAKIDDSLELALAAGLLEA
jgi:hypothetical protein